MHEEYEGSERQQQAAVLRSPDTAISAGGGNTWPVLRDPLGFQWSGRGCLFPVAKFSLGIMLFM